MPLNEPNYRSFSHIDRIRARIANLISPSLGDEATLCNETVVITPIEDEYLIEGYDGDPDEVEPVFSKRVDYMTVNGAVVNAVEEIQFENGVEYDYYWSVERASVDILY